MSSQTVDLSTPENVFRTAANDFRAGLSEEQRADFQLYNDPIEMIKGLQEHFKKHGEGKRSRLLAGCRKIDAFRERVEPYFKVIDILVSSHPEYAGIVWGAIRLVFLLSRHFISFFEKLAELLAKITAELPLYERHMIILKRHAAEVATNMGGANKWRNTLDCLSKSLAYVYADILEFCNDARDMFPKKDQGLVHKTRILQDLFWTPFDTRFSKTLARLKEHKYLYERDLDYVYNEDTLSHHAKLDQEIQRNSRDRQVMDEERKAKQNQALGESVKDLRCWIAAPDWTKAYDEAELQRVEGSCTWFVEQDNYCSWAGTQHFQDHADILLPRLLAISGKPGYGKTVLSSHIIGNLRDRITKEGCPSSRKAVVAYFHFNNRQSEFRAGGEALRAILAQILQACRLSADFIDIASVLHENGRGQTKASDREVREILQLFLQRLSPSYLVFDGLDECTDAECFLESLVELIHNTKCKLVLLARPTVDIVGIVGENNVCHIVLKKDDNSKDIESYLQIRMTRLAKRRAFPSDLELTHIIAQLARRSNSMFLWARLMSNYLSSLYLTPNERSDAIHHLNRFEGLDTMYAKILEELARRVPERQQQKIYKIFQWLVVAQRSFSIEELRTALAVQRHRQATSNDFIQDFENILPQLCGSLVEIHADGTIDFIHLSTVEYLTQPSKPSLGAQQHFQIERSLSQASMADLCLSYMTQEVPEGPLTPSSTPATQRIEVESRLPLLNYISEYWSWHTAQTFLLLHGSDVPQLLSSLSSAINALIHNKRLITTWIEALFLFGKTPNLTVLVSSVITYHESLSSLSEQSSNFVDALGRLCVEIENIYLRWHRVLLEQPNEIGVRVYKHGRSGNS